MSIHIHVTKMFAMGALLAVSVGRAEAQQANVVPSLAPTAPIATALQPVNTDHIRTSQVLGIPTSYCGHVINLLMTNRMRQSFGNAGNHTAQVYAQHLSVGLTPGDLELLCVQLVSDGDPCNGPVFEIGMRNNSQIPIGNFRISVVGVLGRIHMHSPTATIHIPRMEAGCETQVQVQLPVTCMSMGAPGQLCQFDTLIVAVDSFDELLECDELNNVQILTRADIPLLVVAAAAPPVAVESVPAQPLPSAPETVVPQTPEEKAPSPLDDIDLDDLFPGDADKAALLVR